MFDRLKEWLFGPPVEILDRRIARDVMMYGRPYDWRDWMNSFVGFMSW